MTPSYASPEQLRRGALTTASDLYSLGVMLYELLTGSRPLSLSPTDNDDALVSDRFDSIERPCSRLERSLASPKINPVYLTETIKKRVRYIKGDLDSIFLKLLRKEPAQRFSSAQALIDDLQRFLNGEPVLAIRGSRAYYAKHFIKRHVRGISFVTLMLALTITSVSVQQIRLTQERDRAIAEKDLADEERDRADKEKTKYKETIDFLFSLFDASRTETSNGEELTVSDLLQRGEEDINNKLSDQPELKAELLLNIANVYRDLGNFEKAKKLAL